MLQQYDWRARVLADVEGFIFRECNRGGVLQRIRRHLFAVHGQYARATLAQTGSVGLEIERNGVLAGCQLRALPRRALEIEQVVEKYDLAAAKAEFAFAEEQAIAAEAPAVIDDHARRTTLGNLALGSDGVCLVQDPRRRAGGCADQLARIGEDRSSCREARTRRVPASERRVVERQHIVLLG